MNVNEALESLIQGEEIRTVYDGKEIFYEMYQDDTIVKLVAESPCSAIPVSQFTTEQFVKSYEGIEFVKE